MTGMRSSSVGAVGLAASLVVALLVGCVAHADESEKRERRIGEAAADREHYVSELVLFDAKQIALGELALQRSKDPQVRQFAKQLVEDHRRHLGDLRTWADSKALEIAAIDLSTPENEQGVGGSGNAGIQEGYEERMVGVDKDLDDAIGDAQRDLDKVREKQGREFDKAFMSRVMDDQEDGQELIGDGLDEYRADAAFGLLLNRTANLVDRNMERGKKVKKAFD
jgi:predicted outer membrane protein